MSAPPQRAQVVICGAGIAGVSAAYHLAVRHAVRDVVLIDERPPLSLTSDKSTECYRNWWPGPGPAMVSLLNRSIDILEELAQDSGNIFHLNRRGYLYLSADPQRVAGMLAAAQEPPRWAPGSCASTAACRAIRLISLPCLKATRGCRTAPTCSWMLACCANISHIYPRK